VGRSRKWFLNEVKFAPVKNGYTVRKDEYLFLFLQRIGFGLKTQYLETSGKTLDSLERQQPSLGKDEGENIRRRKLS